MSMDMCISKCVGNKREGVHQGHKGRSQRNAYKPEENSKGMVWWSKTWNRRLSKIVFFIHSFATLSRN